MALSSKVDGLDYAIQRVLLSFLTDVVSLDGEFQASVDVEGSTVAMRACV